MKFSSTLKVFLMELGEHEKICFPGSTGSREEVKNVCCYKENV
jgi:hypothetical protein